MTAMRRRDVLKVLVAAPFLTAAAAGAGSGRSGCGATDGRLRGARAPPRSRLALRRPVERAAPADRRALDRRALAARELPRRAGRRRVSRVAPGAEEPLRHGVGSE